MLISSWVVILYDCGMGITKQLGQWRRSEKAKTKMYQLSREIQGWYESHFVAPWQRDRIEEIRALHEKKQKDLGVAHDIAASQVSEEFATLELDYLMASEAFREKNPGEEMPWKPNRSIGFMARVFTKNMIVRAKALGLNWHGEKKTI